MQKQKIAKTVSIRQQDDEPADDEEEDEGLATAQPAAKAVGKKLPKSAAKRAPVKAAAKVDRGAAAKATALRKAIPVDMADDEDAEDGEDLEVTDWHIKLNTACHDHHLSVHPPSPELPLVCHQLL